MKYPIDLGKAPDMGGPVPCCPPDSKGPPEKYYPGVFLTLPNGAELPKTGEICFKYRVASVRESFKDKTRSYDIELLSIVEVESPESGDSGIPDLATAVAEYVNGKNKS